MAPGKRQGCAHRIVAVVTWSGLGGGGASRVVDGGKRRGLRNSELSRSGGAVAGGKRGCDRIVEDLVGGGPLHDNC